MCRLRGGIGGFRDRERPGWTRASAPPDPARLEERVAPTCRRWCCWVASWIVSNHLLVLRFRRSGNLARSKPGDHVRHLSSVGRMPAGAAVRRDWATRELRVIGNPVSRVMESMPDLWQKLEPNFLFRVAHQRRLIDPVQFADAGGLVRVPGSAAHRTSGRTPLVHRRGSGSHQGLCSSGRRDAPRRLPG